VKMKLNKISDVYYRSVFILLPVSIAINLLSIVHLSMDR